MYWKEFNLTMKKYYKFLILIIVILTMEYNAFNNNANLASKNEKKYNLSISMMEGDKDIYSAFKSIEYVSKVMFVNSINEGKSFKNKADVFIYTNNGKYTAYLNHYSNNSGLATSVIDMVANPSKFSLSVLKNYTVSKAALNENLQSGLLMFFTILSTAILLLSYKIVKDDESVKKAIVYSPEDNSRYIKAKIMLMTFVTALFSVLFLMLFEMSIWLTLFVFEVLIVYSLIGFIFAVLSSNKSIIFVYWIAVLGIAIGQMFLVKGLDLNKFIITIQTNGYMWIGIGVVVIFIGYIITQKIWNVVNVCERK